jgi:hypothetical protein
VQKKSHNAFARVTNNFCHNKQSVQAKTCRAGINDSAPGLSEDFFLDKFVSNKVEQARSLLFASRNK